MIMKKTLILVLFLLASTVFAANYKMVRSKSCVSFFIKSMVSNVNGKFKSFQVTEFNKNKDSVSGSQHYADLSITIRGITRSKKGKGFYQASGNVVINRKKFGVT